MLSPLLSNQNTPMQVRVMLTVFITILLTITLYPDYRGAESSFILKELALDQPISIIQVGITTIKEVGIGYLMGLCFTLLFEAVLVAGQVGGVLMGFSIMDIIDPITQTSRPLVSQFFVVTLTLLLLAMDLHFVFFQHLTESFRILPIGNYHLPYEMLDTIAMGSGRLFTWALQFISFPFVILFLITIGLGFMAKIMPEMNIFMVGFPVKILIGYYTLIVAVGYFPRILVRVMVELENLITRLLYAISGT